MATPAEPNSNPTGNENTPPENTPAATPAATPPATSNAPANQQTQHFDASELLTALNALPEKIVNGIREATQPAKAPATPKTNAGTGDAGNGAQTAAQPAQTAKHTEPDKKTFAQRWFG
jgi:hypothetical protein